MTRHVKLCYNLGRRISGLPAKVELNTFNCTGRNSGNISAALPINSHHCCQYNPDNFDLRISEYLPDIQI